MGRTPHLGGLSRPHHRDEEVAHAAMEEVGIADLSEKAYTKLSGGQRQLVLLARAIAQDTPVDDFGRANVRVGFPESTVGL